MSYKLICPNCDMYTSAVFHAYADGRPCPHCNKSLHDNDGRTARSYYAQTAGLWSPAPGGWQVNNWDNYRNDTGL